MSSSDSAQPSFSHVQNCVVSSLFFSSRIFLPKGLLTFRFHVGRIVAPGGWDTSCIEAHAIPHRKAASSKLSFQCLLSTVTGRELSGAGVNQKLFGITYRLRTRDQAEPKHQILKLISDINDRSLQASFPIQTTAGRLCCLGDAC